MKLGFAVVALLAAFSASGSLRNTPKRAPTLDSMADHASAEVELSSAATPANRTLRIRVEDAETGAPLDQVSILMSAGLDTDTHIHPGDGKDFKVIVAGGHSPVEIPRKLCGKYTADGIYLVGSPGYAWANIPLSLGSSGERRVRLERGGQLGVTLESRASQRNAVLRLYAQGSEHPAASVRLGDSTRIDLADLAVGSYRLRVEVGNHIFGNVHYPPLVLAHGTADLSHTDSCQVSLAWDSQPELVRTRLSGTLTLPPNWEIDHFIVVATFLDPPLDGVRTTHTARRDELELLSDSTYAFDFGLVQTGRYDLRLALLYYGRVIELGPDGLPDLKLAVPPLVEVRVFVRDEATGGMTHNVCIAWSCSRGPDGQWREYQHACVTDGEDFIRLHVPPGEISIGTYSCTSATDSHAPTTFMAEQDLEVKLIVWPTATAVLTLLDGETQVPWPRDDNPQVQRTGGGDGEASGWPGHRLGLHVSATRPGLYMLPIPAIRGFEPHAPVEIDAVLGRSPPIKVQLTRIP